MSKEIATDRVIICSKCQKYLNYIAMYVGPSYIPFNLQTILETQAKRK